MNLTQALQKATRWMRLNPEAPLPLDLAFELSSQGLNIEEVETSILKETQDGKNK
jgi:hypothetical protein